MQALDGIVVDEITVPGSSPLLYDGSSIAPHAPRLGAWMEILAAERMLCGFACGPWGNGSSGCVHAEQ